MKLLFSAALLLTASWSSIANDDPHHLSQAIDTMLSEHQLPGMVLHVKHNGRTIYFKAHGKVNIEGQKSIEQDDIFRIFSMTKPITTVALLQLVEQGKVSLSDDIRKHLPAFEPFEFEGKQQTVTVHQLLSHTAGFGYGGGLSTWSDIRYLIANPLSRSNTLEDLVDDISGIDLKYAPGTQWEYSIANDVQGALIEAVSGQSLRDYFKQYLFTPLNMPDTDFYVPKHKHNRLVDMYEYDATYIEEAYVFNKDKIELSEHASDSDYLTLPALYSGGGGLVSTAKDYSNFVSMLLNGGQFNGQHILSPKLVALMTQSHTQDLSLGFLPRIYQGIGFGYGLAVKEATNHTRAAGSYFWAGMGGTVFWADPKNNLQVVAMMQVEDGWIALEKWLIPHIYQLLASEQ